MAVSYCGSSGAVYAVLSSDSEDLKRQMLQIHEIDDVFFSFYSGKIVKKAYGQIRDSPDRLSHQLHPLKNAAGLSALILLSESLHIFLSAVPKRHGRIFFGGIHFRVFRWSKLRQVPELHIQNFDDPVPEIFHLNGVPFAGLLRTRHIAEGT